MENNTTGRAAVPMNSQQLWQHAQDLLKPDRHSPILQWGSEHKIPPPAEEQLAFNRCRERRSVFFNHMMRGKWATHQSRPRSPGSVGRQHEPDPIYRGEGKTKRKLKVGW